MEIHCDETILLQLLRPCMSELTLRRHNVLALLLVYCGILFRILHVQRQAVPTRRNVHQRGNRRSRLQVSKRIRGNLLRTYV